VSIDWKKRLKPKKRPDFFGEGPMTKLMRELAEGNIKRISEDLEKALYAAMPSTFSPMSLGPLVPKPAELTLDGLDTAFEYSLRWGSSLPVKAPSHGIATITDPVESDDSE
jgi:hypothetical protein